MSVSDNYVRIYSEPLPVHFDEESNFQLPPTHLRLYVLQAQNLRNADADSGDPRDQFSDPFVIITFTDVRGQPYDNLMFKTQTVEENLDPRWDEEFLLELKANNAACAVQFEVWDADKATGRDFLGLAKIQLDAPRSDSTWLPLGPRPSLGRQDRSLQDAGSWGKMRIKWQYERISSPQLDALWFCRRAKIARTNRKYELSMQLFKKAIECDPHNTEIQEEMEETMHMDVTEAKGVKEDMTETAISEDALQRRFKALDLNNNGYIDKSEFKNFYREMSYGGVCHGDDAMDELLRKYNMLGDDRISYQEFAILMLKLAQW